MLLLVSCFLSYNSFLLRHLLPCELEKTKAVNLKDSNGTSVVLEDVEPVFLNAGELRVPVLNAVLRNGKLQLEFLI